MAGYVYIVTNHKKGTLYAVVTRNSVNESMRVQNDELKLITI